MSTTVNLTAMTFNNGRQELHRLARRQFGIIAGPEEVVKVSVYKGMVNIDVGGYNVFRVAAPNIDVSVNVKETA